VHRRPGTEDDLSAHIFRSKQEAWKLYEIVGRDGWVMCLDKRGNMAWHEASEIALGAPMGFFSYQLFGKPHAAIGPQPAPGVTNPKVTWHPGIPPRAAKAPPGGVPEALDTYSPDEAWAASQRRVFGAAKAAPAGGQTVPAPIGTEAGRDTAISRVHGPLRG
jgi:hypothetical protein